MVISKIESAMTLPFFISFLTFPQIASAIKYERMQTFLLRNPFFCGGDSGGDGKNKAKKKDLESALSP